MEMTMRMQEAKAVKVRKVVAPAGSKWFAVRSATRREQDLVMALAGLGLHAWYPKTSYWRHARSSVKKAQRPLFPGFVFVLTTDAELHLVHKAERDGFHQVVRCYGADKLLHPLVLPDVIMGDLIMREEFGDFDEIRKAGKFKPSQGDVVGIAKGKWAGFVAKILSVSAEQKRVMLDMVSLDEAPVSLPFSVLRPVEGNGGACAKAESDAVSSADDRLGQMRHEKLSQRDGPIQPPERR